MTAIDSASKCLLGSSAIRIPDWPGLTRVLDESGCDRPADKQSRSFTSLCSANKHWLLDRSRNEVGHAMIHCRPAMLKSTIQVAGSAAKGMCAIRGMPACILQPD